MELRVWMPPIYLDVPDLSVMTYERQARYKAPSNVGHLQSTHFLDPQAITTPNTIQVSHVMLYAGVNYEMHIIGATEAPSQSLLNPDVGIYTSDFKHLLLQQDNTPSSVDPALFSMQTLLASMGSGWPPLFLVERENI